MRIHDPSKPHNLEEIDSARPNNSVEPLLSPATEHSGTFQLEDTLECFIDFDAFAYGFGPEGGLGYGL